MNYIINNQIFRNIAFVTAFVFAMGIVAAPSAHAQYVRYVNNTPVYSYNYVYPVQQYSAIQASCYPNSSSASINQIVIWNASISGGNGSYYVSWSGDEGLTGTGQSISKAYSYSGYKNATMTVTSAGQTVSVGCNGSVNVYSNTYYVAPTTYYNYSSYNPIQISCSANTANASVGSPVTWSASVSGGNGYYSYTWSGSDNLTGYSQSLAATYTSLGTKTAAVTVYSNGQSATESCSNSVNINGYQNSYVTSGSSNNNAGLDVGCYADPISASIDQPVTWNVEVTGGTAPYTYSWTGSDSLNSSSVSAIKYYESSGTKSAIVSVTSSDGKSLTKACSNAVTVRRASAPSVAYAQPAPSVQSSSQQQSNSAQQSNDNNGLSAATLFSLGSIPWGWVVVLVILVLFGTVIYLLFNRPKI
jgi:hypothetical protein